MGVCNSAILTPPGLRAYGGWGQISTDLVCLCGVHTWDPPPPRSLVVPMLERLG